MRHVVSLSGGKDSTAMLLMMIERGMQIDEIVYVDTTKEFPQMYEHLEKLSDYIKPLEITRLSFDFDYWFSEYIITKGKRKGEKGYGWARSDTRWCTRIKTRLIDKHTKDSMDYVGIAYDEIHRIKPNKIYPLIEWQITEEQALQYCYSKGFDWGGLYERFHRLSCFCCPLQGIGDLRNIHNHHPELWQEMSNMDKKSYYPFHSRYTLQELNRRFEREILEAELQMNLFKN